MKRDLRPFALPAFALGVIALLIAGALYVVRRQFDIYEQIAIGVGALGLALGVLFDPARVRRALTGRQARYGGNAVLISLAFLGILIVLNYLLYTNPVQADFTADREFTLAPETLLALSRLPGPVQIKGFYTPELRSSADELRPLLEQYRLHSDGLVSYEFINPYESPVEATQYGVTQDGSLVVLYGEASEVIPFAQEQDITSALIHMANPEGRKVYFLTGHGERDIEEPGDPGYSQARQSLESKNYTVEALNLLVEARVPDDALAVIVAGPLTPLTAEEGQALEEYLDAGGALVLLQQPRAESRFGSAVDPLETLMANRWGITLRDDVVIEPNSRNFLLAISFLYADHDITERLRSVATLFPAARSLALADSTSAGFSPTSLIESSDVAWGETDLSFLDTQSLPEFQDGVEAPGPLTLAAIADDPAGGGRVVVVGDADFGSNAFFRQQANGDLLVNLIDWAAGQEGLIDLTPRPSTQRFVVPPSTQVTGLILLTTVVLIPGAVIGLGAYVWWQRRKNV